MSRMRHALYWIIVIALVGAPVVGAELLLRRAGLGHPILFYTNASYRFAVAPNQHQVRQMGAGVTIDSKGFRAVKDWSSPADGKLMFIGDSVTWGGTYIDDADTFAAGVCERLDKATGNTFICGNAAANQYGTDNMAARIRYRQVDDETVLIVTLISGDTLRGLRDADGSFFFTAPPPGPFKAVWEATTFLAWRLYRAMRPLEAYRPEHDARVAERSLENLFAAIRATQRPGRKVLIVLSPLEQELKGSESPLTAHVRSVLARSGFDFLDLHAAVSAAHAPDFYYDGEHLAVRGHRFYADQIAARLLANP
jgi:hypothetical protein